MQLPYIEISAAHDSFTKSVLNDVMHEALTLSEESPCYIEVFDNTQQRCVFFRERQVYSAGFIKDGQINETTIREFLLAASKMNFPQLKLYRLNNKTLHSILILLQKKPTLKVLTSLVDLDELLDRIESEGKSCVVTASRDNFLAALRYDKGKVTAMSHELSQLMPAETSFREDFLVKIYTITVDEPVTLNLYEDLLVSYASDAKTIAKTFAGSFDELFLSKPPVINLAFKGKEINHWIFDRPSFNIGRTPDNDIAIDNLAVSRLHAVLEEEKGNYYIRDCDSLNGTCVNGQRVGRARLNDADEISIGKHTITFRKQGGQTLPAEETIQGFDQTVILDAHPAEMDAPQPSETESESATDNPRLVIKTAYGDRVIEVKEDGLSIGKSMDADIFVEGAFVAKTHVEISNEDGKVVLRKVGRLRKVTVGGKTVDEVELQDNDEICIANEAFIFQT